MKHIATTLIIVLTYLSLPAQTDKKESETESSEEQFISFKAPYPREATEARIEGTINFTYDIDSSCNIVNIKADTTLGYGCDEYALKYLKHFEKLNKRKNYWKCEPKTGETIPCEFRLH